MTRLMNWIGYGACSLGVAALVFSMLLAPAPEAKAAGAAPLCKNGCKVGWTAPPCTGTCAAGGGSCDPLQNQVLCTSCVDAVVTVNGRSVCSCLCGAA